MSNVPDTWPGAFGLYKYSKQAVKRNLNTVVVLWVLSVIVGGALEWKLKNSGGLFSLVVGSLLTAALVSAYLAGVRDQVLSLGEAFNRGLAVWLKMIGLTLLVAVSVIGSALLLIVPVFFVLPRLTLANYFLVDKDLGVIEAYKASWNATKGHALRAWGIILANIAMALLMVTVIGIPFSIYFLIMYAAAFAVFYEFLGKAQPAAKTASAPAPPAA